MSNQKAADAASPSVTEVLKEARRRIAIGWCRGSDGYMDRPGSAKCAQGHLVDICGGGALIWDGNTYVDACRLVIRAAGLRPDEDGIPEWNDKRGRTKEEVLAAFDRAIALSEGTRLRKEAPHE